MEQQNVKPKHIHALWVLLRNVKDEKKPIDIISYGEQIFGYAALTDIKTLVHVGVALKLIKQVGTILTLTVEGKNFASLNHWRFWKCPSTLPECFQFIQAWFLPDQDQTERRPVVIDLFSGAGGLGLGFERAGFHVAVAVDNDPQAAEAHRRNFPNCNMLEGDINNIALDPRKHLCSDFGIDSNNVSGIIGGPPCQGFSYIGERSVDDERNLLTSRFMDVVLDIEPDFFVMENVSGLMTSGISPDFSIFVERLAKNIGLPASEIVDSIPRVPQSIAKRDRQFRKRLVSGVISRVKNHLKGESEGVLRPEAIFTSTRGVYNRLCEQFLETLSQVYNDSGIPSITPNVTMALAKISIAAIIEEGRKRKTIKEKAARGLVESLATNSEHKEISMAAGQILMEYDVSPPPSHFKGKRIGPVLMHLIERAQEKYEVTVPQVLNSAWFGTPQGRKRLFLVGIHKRLKRTFSFPTQLYNLPEPNGKNILPIAPTCFEAIGDLPNIDDFHNLIETDTLSFVSAQPTSTYSAKARLDEISLKDKSLPRPDWNPFLLDCCKRTIHADYVVERIRKTREGTQDDKSHRPRLRKDSVSNTLRAGTREGKGSHTAVRPIHYEHDRVISVREGARLMGYPDWMTFHPSKWHGFRLVGNGVPAELGESVASKIYKLLKESE